MKLQEKHMIKEEPMSKEAQKQEEKHLLVVWINVFTVTKEVIGLVNALDEGHNQEIEKCINLIEDVLFVVKKDIYFIIVPKKMIVKINDTIEVGNLKEVIQMRVEMVKKKDVPIIIEDKEAILDHQEEKEKVNHSEEIGETEIEAKEEIKEVIPEEVEEDQIEIKEEDKKLDVKEVHLHIKDLQHPGGKKIEDKDINKKN